VEVKRIEQDRAILQRLGKATMETNRKLKERLVDVQTVITHKLTYHWEGKQAVTVYGNEQAIRDIRGMLESFPYDDLSGLKIEKVTV
jgi:hypothetical protein